MSKKSQKIIRHMVIKVKPAAMKKAAPKSAYNFLAPSCKKAPILYKGWKIYTDSRGYLVTGRNLIIKGRKVRRVVSGNRHLGITKGRIDQLYARGVKNAD